MQKLKGQNEQTGRSLTQNHVLIINTLKIFSLSLVNFQFLVLLEGHIND